MKRFLIFLVILALLAGGGYYWWQQNAKRLVTQQVQRLAQNFFVNPENLTIGPDDLSVQMKGLKAARVPKLVISGQKLALRDGPKLEYAKLVLYDVDVAGPPFRLTKIGNGSYLVKVSDDAVTEYLHTRKGKIVGMNLIPLDSLSVQFLAGKSAMTLLRGGATVPLINKTVPITATGTLVAASKSGQIDLRIEHVKVERLSVGMKQVKDALLVVNPVVDLSEWPLKINVGDIKTGNGTASVAGEVTGVDAALFSF